MRRASIRCLLFASLVPLTACGSGATNPDLGSPAGDLAMAAESIVGRCSYTNMFSQGPECREYIGTGWTAADTMADCTQQQGTYEAGLGCSFPSLLGRCLLSPGPARQVRVVLPGTDATKCDGTKRGCELFAGGTFVPDPLCGGK